MSLNIYIRTSLTFAAHTHGARLKSCRSTYQMTLHPIIFILPARQSPSSGSGVHYVRHVLIMQINARFLQRNLQNRQCGLRVQCMRSTFNKARKCPQSNVLSLIVLNMIQTPTTIRKVCNNLALSSSKEAHRLL